MMLRASEWVSVWSLGRCVRKNDEGRVLTSNLKFDNNRRRKVIVCGLRSSYKKLPPSRVLSKEGIQVIHALKLAKSSEEKLHHVLNTKLARLFKADVLDLLGELHRQNELHLSLKVFDYIIREEPGYDTVLPLYSDMILLLGRNKMFDTAQELFSKMTEKGLKPDTRLFNEMIGIYLQVGNTEKAMELYGTMKEDCSPDKLTFTMLIRYLQKNGQQELADTLEQECVHYVDSPDKFIKQVQQTHAKKRHLNLV